MKPVLFSFHLPWNIPAVGDEITFPAYFTLLTLGFGVAMWLTVREARRTGLDPQLILDANLWAIVWGIDRKSTRLNSSHIQKSRMPSSA